MSDTTPTTAEARTLIGLPTGGEASIRGTRWIRLDEDWKASPHTQDNDRDCEWWSYDELRFIAQGQVGNQ